MVRNVAAWHKFTTQKMRTDLKLAARSKLVSQEEFQVLLQSTEDVLERVQEALKNGSHILELVNTNYRHLYPVPEFATIGITKSMTLKEKKELFGIDASFVEEREPVKKLVKQLQVSQSARRASQWCWRVGQEALYLDEKNWYPFFVTLTVDHRRDDRQFETDQKGRRLCYRLFKVGNKNRKSYLPEEYNDIPFKELVFKDQFYMSQYRKKLFKIAGLAGGYTARQLRKMSERELLRHSDVLEHGAHDDHHHSHMMIWMRYIPEGWKRDPNEGLKGEFCTNRSCRQLNALWDWATGETKQAIYFRSANDVWARKCFHVAPIDETGQSVCKLPPAAAGAYLSKYLGKDKKQWNHKVRATRGLGLDRLKEYLAKLSVDQLKQLERPEYDVDALFQRSVESGLSWSTVRNLASDELYKKTFMDMTPSEILSEKPIPYSNMVDSVVRKKERPWRMKNADRVKWLQSCMPEEKESLRPEIFDPVFKEICETFKMEYKPLIVVGGM